MRFFKITEKLNRTYDYMQYSCKIFYAAVMRPWIRLLYREKIRLNFQVCHLQSVLIFFTLNHFVTFWFILASLVFFYPGKLYLKVSFQLTTIFNDPKTTQIIMT